MNNDRTVSLIFPNKKEADNFRNDLLECEGELMIGLGMDDGIATARIGVTYLPVMNRDNEIVMKRLDS